MSPDAAPASALLLLQASERLISAWDHPTMDGGALAKAKREFREAFAAAATEHRLAAQNAQYDHERCGAFGGCAAPVADFDPDCPANRAGPPTSAYSEERS